MAKKKQAEANENEIQEAQAVEISKEEQQEQAALDAANKVIADHQAELAANVPQHVKDAQAEIQAINEKRLRNLGKLLEDAVADPEMMSDNKADGIALAAFNSGLLPFDGALGNLFKKIVKRQKRLNNGILCDQLIKRGSLNFANPAEAETE